MSDNNNDSIPQIKYDVFVSFRGGDIRRGLLSHLIRAFKSNHINVFVDDRLEKGEEIWLSLVEAIEGSAILLIIFSPNYASSRWCLEELVKIVECKEKYKHIVIPIFYNVEPTGVRHQLGKYKYAFDKHKTRYDDTKVQLWRSALETSANLSGIDSSSCQNDDELLQKIINLVRTRLQKPMGNLNELVGIDETIADVESLILKEPKDTCLTGIWGMGGIGKTTLAEELFIKLQSQYAGSYLLVNERDESRKHGIIYLKNTIFSKLLGCDVEINTQNSLPGYIVRRTRCMKVIIVLDDVNDSEHVEQLLGTPNNFGSGSRIIVTTRDMQVLRAINVNEIYQLRELSFDKALELFNLKAFGQSDHQREYDELSKRLVHYAKGIPLVVKVLASLLRGKKKEVWESELDKLKKMPHPKVYDVLKLSYDDLDSHEQKIFLDLACFVLRLHRKLKVSYLISLLKDNGSSVVVGLDRLQDKALITLSKDNFISMHDSLREMGCEIVRRNSRKDPRSTSWLWDSDDICEALENDKGTKAIRSIQIDLTKIMVEKLSPNIFTKMSRLKFLEIYIGSNQHNNILAEGLHLRFLSWYSYHLTSLPESFSTEELVILKLRGGRMEKLWDGLKNLINLKELDLSQSSMLKELPDLSKATNLEVLLLWGCSKLTIVHPSIFSLPKLEKLDLWNCKSLKKLVSDSHLESLVYLNLGGCDNLEEFSVISKNMKDLRLGRTEVKGHQRNPESLHLEECSIRWLTLSFKSFTQLINLKVSDCKWLETIVDLPPFLETLDVENCISVLTIPDLPPSLKTLNVKSCYLKSLPEFPPSLETLNVSSIPLIKTLPKLHLSLETLIVHGCTSLQALPEFPQSLKTLNVNRCTSLQALPEFPQSLKTLHVHSCTTLPTLPKLPHSIKTLYATSLCIHQTLPKLPSSLETLYVYTSSLKSIPELPMSLKTLDANNCSSLQTLPKLPMSLNTLVVYSCYKLQSLPELPTSLKTLDVRNCSSLQTLPKLPMSLKTLKVHGCYSLQILPELPTSFETLLDVHWCHSLQTLAKLPTSLESLNAQRCFSLQTLLKLPASLKTLDVTDCKSLHTLGELPQSLEILNVRGCISLETLPKLPLFLKTLDASGCKSLKTVEELRDNMTRVLFWNCLNLDEYSLVHIVLNAQINMTKYASQCLSTPNCRHVENYSDYDDRDNHHSYQSVYAYPGNSVPEWLEYKTRKDYIIIDLSSAPPSPHLGFIFCFVLCEVEVNKDYCKARLEVDITIGDCEGECKHDNVRMYIQYPPFKIESDHVCVVYDQRCSSFLNSRAKNQTRFKIQVTLGTQDDALWQGYNGGTRFGVSPISTLA